MMMPLQHVLSKAVRIGAAVCVCPSSDVAIRSAGRRWWQKQKQWQSYSHCRRALFSSAENETSASPSGSIGGITSVSRKTGAMKDDSEYGLYRLLTQEERSLLHEQRQLKGASRRVAAQVMAMEGWGGGGRTAALDMKSSSFLEELELEATFSVVVAGEFNAGKSTLINALLGRKLLETGALPTTDSITIVGSREYHDHDDDETGKASAKRSVPLGVVLHAVPDLPLLEDLTLIDSPGTNSTWMDHTERTMRLLPAADMILFVTSADRPFSESERTLLQSIQAYRKSIVVVINKMDILDIAGGNHGEEQKQAVVDFVTDKASELLGSRPVVIPVSARDALSAKIMEKTTPTKDDETPHNQQRSNVWIRSNFASLETFLKESLTTKAKLKSKLSNPLGVAEGAMNECTDILQTLRANLKVDVATLNIFQNQFDGWKKELAADLALSRATMTEMVRQEGQRCQILMSRMTLHNFYYCMLVDPTQLHEEWEQTKREVSIYRHRENLKADLMERVQETADTVATRGRAQGQAAIEYLGKRPAMKNQSLIGSVTAASRFEDTRKKLEEQLSGVVDSTIKNESEQSDKNELFQSLKQTALVSAVLQMGALGSGLLLASDLVDPVVGSICFASLATAGGGSYTIGTARIARHFQENWSRRAHTLDKAVDVISGTEVNRVNRRILDGVAPYTRFVESEQERIDVLEVQCEGIISASRNLRNRINKLV